MSDKATLNRNRIIDIANQLFYFRGFNQTSFTDIAEQSAIPRGNFYYYFKSKDEILEAVIEKRLSDIRRQLTGWDAQFESPYERIICFIEMTRDEAEQLIKYGCPMGSLNMELGKTQPELKKLAKQMFDLYKAWLAKQFAQLRIAEDPEDFATQLLIRAQGMAVLAHTYGDRAIVTQETARILHWLEEFK